MADMLTTRKKQKVVKEFQVHEKDTGSTKVQAALLTKQIGELVDHLKHHPKDHHSRRGLLKMVAKRKKLSDYLSKKDPKTHAEMVKSLGLKK